MLKFPSLVFLFILILFRVCVSQNVLDGVYIDDKSNHFSCEGTPVGKLIIKPLMKNGSVDYSLAIDKDLYQTKDGVVIWKDSTGQTIIARSYHLKEDSVVILECSYFDQIHDCYFNITISFKVQALYKYNKTKTIKINSAGKFQVTNADDYSQLEQRQKEVDDLLKYFE